MPAFSATSFILALLLSFSAYAAEEAGRIVHTAEIGRAHV